MSRMSSETLIGLIISFILGILTKLFGDRFAEAKLEMSPTTSSFLLKDCELEPQVVRWAEGKNIRPDVLAYRVRITNKHKRILNTPARNCVAWLDPSGAPDSYQLAWVGTKETVTINVGDSREVDICGIPVRYGIIIAPTEFGYNFPRPRTLGGAGIALEGLLRVTCENGQPVQRRIRIDVAANNDALNIILEK